VVSELKEVPHIVKDPRNGLRDDQDFSPLSYGNHEWIVNLRDTYADRYMFEFSQCFSFFKKAIADSNIPLVFVNLPICALVDVVKVNNKKFVYDDKEMMRGRYNIDGIQGDLKVIDTISKEDVIFILFRSLHRDPLIIQKIINVNPSAKFIVCDPEEMYVGCTLLKASPFNDGYQIASNLIGIEYTSKVEFNVHYIRKQYEYIPTDIVMRYNAFCFVGIETIPVMKYIMAIDVFRKKKYFSVDKNKRQQLDTDEPILFVVGSNIGFLQDLVRDKDCVYSIVIKHEMSATFLSKTLSTLGVVDANFLVNLGFFNKTGLIKNAYMHDGLIVPMQEAVEVQVNFPYLMRSPVFRRFKYDTGQEGSDSVCKIIPYFDEVSIVLFTQCGIIRLGSKCSHVSSYFNGILHDHVFKVIKKKKNGRIVLFS